MLSQSPSHSVSRWIYGLVVLLGSSYACTATAAPAGSLSQVFKKVSGSVVVVHTVGHDIPRGANEKPASIQGIGSGVLVSADGKVVTAAHVVQTADAVAVEFPGDSTRILARVIASDPAADVALLQLDKVPAGRTPVKMGDSDKAEVGDQVFVVGAPLGISHTLTVGHLSARRTPNMTFGGMGIAELFQTDAAINQGNSGGPMFDMNGEVIGIVSHIISRSGGSEGLGFVVTSNLAHRLLFDEPSVWSGLEGYLLTGGAARVFNIPNDASGLLVQRVAAGSAAQRMGLEGGSVSAQIGEEELVLGGDIILAVEGIALNATDAYEKIRRRLIELRTSGGTLHVSILRGGATLELTSTTTN